MLQDLGSRLPKRVPCTYKVSICGIGIIGLVKYPPKELLLLMIGYGKYGISLTMSLNAGLISSTVGRFGLRIRMPGCCEQTPGAASCFYLAARASCANLKVLRFRHFGFKAIGYWSVGHSGFRIEGIRVWASVEKDGKRRRGSADLSLVIMTQLFREKG